MSFKKWIAAGMAAATLMGAAVQVSAVEYGGRELAGQSREEGISPHYAAIDYIISGIENGYAYCELNTQYSCSMSISMVLYKANDRGGWGRIATKSTNGKGTLLELSHPVEEDGTRYKVVFTCIADGEKETVTSYS